MVVYDFYGTSGRRARLFCWILMEAGLINEPCPRGKAMGKGLPLRLAPMAPPAFK